MIQHIFAARFGVEGEVGQFCKPLFLELIIVNYIKFGEYSEASKCILDFR